MEKNKIITKKYFLFTGISKKDNYGIIMVRKLKNGYKDLKYGDQFVHMSGSRIVNFPKCDWSRIKNLGFGEVIYHYGFNKNYNYVVDDTLIKTGFDLREYKYAPKRIVFNWSIGWEEIHEVNDFAVESNFKEFYDDNDDDDYYDVYHPLSDAQSRANKVYQKLLRSRAENQKNAGEIISTIST